MLKARKKKIQTLCICINKFVSFQRLNICTGKYLCEEKEPTSAITAGSGVKKLGNNHGMDVATPPKTSPIRAPIIKRDLSRAWACSLNQISSINQDEDAIKLQTKINYIYSLILLNSQPPPLPQKEKINIRNFSSKTSKFK